LTHIYLIRHGAYTDVEDGRYRDDPELSSAGVRQTELLQARLAHTGEIKADALLTSPLRRAQESAHILAPAVGQPVVVDEDLREWRTDDGNLVPGEFEARWEQTPAVQRPFFRWANGCETWLEFTVRIQQALNRLIEEYDGKTLVLVTHGEVIQASFIYFFGMNATSFPGVSLKNTSMTCWFKPPHMDIWFLERYNDHQHL